jgi:release factor glutamine methyltransferase
MPRVIELLKLSTEYLGKRGVESARLNAELLLAQALSLPRLKLYLEFEREVGEPELTRYRDWIKRRGQREPLQHLLGQTGFCKATIQTTRAALIPRPETELLAERGWTFLRGRGAEAEFLDIGTGTGCVAIAMLLELPGTVRAVGVDLSPEAAALAAVNAEKNAVTARMEVLTGDVFEVIPEGRRFDLIVSNPPYIPSAEIEGLTPEVRDFDPRLALDGGADGLDFYRKLAARAGAWLKPGGVLWIEFGDGQAQALSELFAAHKWIVGGVEKDYSGRERLLMATPEGV